VLYTATRDLNPDSQICFFDKDGNFLSGNEDLKDSFNAEDVNRGFQWTEVNSQGKKEILSSYSTPDSPIVQVSKSVVTAAEIQSSETLLLVITLITAVVLSVFASGAFISSNIARPIDLLTEAMTNTKTDGELHEINLSLPNNEIRGLADSYNSMIVHINNLIAELIEKENSIRKAEMRTLQEQIKPHFLYNSIETLSYMALQSNAPNVHDALETLGSFYRNFLSKGSREIPLRNELLIVKDYLALQKLRYGDVFDDEYIVEEPVLKTLIPKLILQPLVENSLYHGVRLKGEKGLIRISAFEKDEAVHITVYDTGVGMTQQQISDVLSGFSADEEEELSGFGLKGTIERMRYYCNDHEVIQIRSELGEYTEIEIIIPKEK
jgi:two-component system sensor histidine kinase YesM